MDRERIVRDWFGAIRDAADGAVREWEAAFAPNGTQKRQMDMLLRQFLCDRLPARIMEVKDLDSEQAEAVRRDVYSQLIEDALAGTGFGDADMALVAFLGRCESGVEDEAVFRELLAEASGGGAEAVKAAAERAREAAWAKLTALTAKKEPPPPRPRRDDEPPPWLDEFEYIDWMITH